MRSGTREAQLTDPDGHVLTLKPPCRWQKLEMMEVRRMRRIRVGGALRAPAPVASVGRSFPRRPPALWAYSAATCRSTARTSQVQVVTLSAAKVPPVLISRAGLDRPELNGLIDRFMARPSTSVPRRCGSP